MKLKDKVAIITGSAQGIGQGISERFALEGAKIVLADINMESLKKVEKKLKEIGANVFSIKTDVSDYSNVLTLVNTTINSLGRIDILVNNAGVDRSVLIENMTEEEWDRIIDVNLKGTFLCTKAVIPTMKKMRSGNIINLASPAGKTGGIKVPCAHYCASKAGIICFTKSAARELAVYNIRVNAISPGFIETDMTFNFSDIQRKELNEIIPLNRPGTVDDIAKAAVFLASDDSNYITGQVIPVNGGMWMFY